MDNFLYCAATEGGTDDLNSVTPLAVVGGVIDGIEQQRLQHNERRRLYRQYLTRANLLPNPRADTPFQQLRQARNNRAYITTMGLDIATFEYVLFDQGFEHQWNTSTRSCWCWRNRVAKTCQRRS
jgi:hypothetical protein